MDVGNAATLLAYIRRDKRHEKKFRHIVELIVRGLRNTELYNKEDINERCRHVTAMKLFKGQENDRIYCQEVTRADRTFVVITAELHERKKTQKNGPLEINLIEKVAAYQYDIAYGPQIEIFR